MSFNSWNFFIFLPVVYLLFHLTRERWRWLTLLAASFVFYGALGAPHLLAVLAAVILVTYGAGLGIERAEAARKKGIFWGGVAANVAILAALKYLPAALAAGKGGAGLAVPPALLVSIGVSYYVFQAISYLIDVYLEMETAERHLGLFALHMSFFPKLLQGPIERPGDLLPQLRRPYVFDYDLVRRGMLLFMWGMFKRVAVADRLGFYVNSAYGDVHAYGGLPLLLATYAYALQIYCDFSGYTDMALGTGMLFNIRLTRNFNAPYSATSIQEFWRRWHISFSRWILDYIFKPLQMELRDLRRAGTALALLATFAVSGIWHGATLGFLIWGVLHGLYLSASTFYRPLQKRIHRALHLEKSPLLHLWQVAVTFHLVCFSWIFFRAKSLGDALYVVRHLGDGARGLPEFLYAYGKGELAISLIVVAVVLAIDGRSKKPDLDRVVFTRPAFVRWSLYLVLTLSTLFLTIDSTNLFIYTQF